MGEWAVIMVDVLDSMDPDPYTGLVNFGPDGGVTDFVGKYFAEQMSKCLSHGNHGRCLLADLTDAQIDQLVDMGFTINVEILCDSYLDGYHLMNRPGAMVSKCMAKL